MLKKLLENIKDKKYYLIIVIILYVYLIFMNQPFDTSHYIYTSQNSVNLVNQTNLFVAKSKVSQKFIAERDDLIKVGIKTVTQDRNIDSKVNIEIKEVETKKNIYNKDISLIGAKNDSYFEIEIERQKSSKSKEYEITITSLDAEKENATMFALADNTEYSGETYKYNNEEIKENKLMISTEYYSFSSEVFHIVLWVLLFVLSVMFILFGLEGADEKAFLKLVTFVTILYIFVTPFPHYLDEGAHFFRAVLISQGSIYDDIDENGEIGGYVSKNFIDYVIHGITLKKLSNNTAPTGDLFGENMIFNPFKYFSSTVPTGHMIPAIALFIGKILSLNSCLTIYLSRLLPYIFYITCSYFAIKNLKYYKSIMFIVATLPIALYLAGSVSLDPIINGSVFLFISICLKYYFNVEENSYITKKDIALIIITAIFIITNKYLTYTPLLLLFFLIPKKKFKTNKAYITMIVVSVIIGIFCVLWQFYMLKAFPYEEDRNENVNQAEQIEFTLGHPIYVMRGLIVQLVGHAKVHTLLFAPNPLGTFPDLTGAILLVGAILEKNKMEKEKRKKFLSIILITMFLMVFMLAVFALYLSYSPVGSDGVSGYQIRYNVPILMLILIPIANCFNIDNKTKNHEKKIVFFMFLLNLDTILTILMHVFKEP